MITKAGTKNPYWVAVDHIMWRGFDRTTTLRMVNAMTPHVRLELIPRVVDWAHGAAMTKCKSRTGKLGGGIQACADGVFVALAGAVNNCHLGIERLKAALRADGIEPPEGEVIDDLFAFLRAAAIATRFFADKWQNDQPR
ncbi:MAG: hypothetical protein HY459_02235 [Parcubacteria group bacterium]|nr:hypothetical protein [Parcubacteria group bacterium]